jgi:biotin carboxyl carrier protein
MFRVLLGIGLLLSGAYVIVGEHLVGVSADATINAPLVTVRSPIDGALSLTVKRVGARLAQAERLGEVQDARADVTRLADLNRISSVLDADGRKYGQQRNNLISARLLLAQQADDYRKGRINQLQAKLLEAKAEIDAARARSRESESVFSRARNLSDRGVQSAANVDKAQAGFEVSVQDIEVAKQKVEYLTIELEAARNGTFLGDSYNDAPYSVQRIRDLDLKLFEISADIDYVNVRKKQVEDQINQEALRLSRMTGAEITTPVRGLVWDFLGHDGETVRKGQDVLRIVDCDRAMITASVSERLYNRLKVGDGAQFRLLGDDRVFDATVARLAGSGAQTRYETLAIGATPQHLTRYDVTLTAPGLTDGSSQDCAVGRTGRVIFAEGMFSSVRRLLLQAGL